MKFLPLAALALLASPLSAQWHPSPFPATPPTAGFVLQSAFPELSFPRPDRLVGLTANAGRLFIVERGGRVYVITNLARPTKTLFLNLSADVWVRGDSGLLGLAFHPDGRSLFTWSDETNRAAGNLVNRLARWTVDPANPNRVIPGSKTLLLEQVDRDPYHSGGDIQFGPDGYLYVPLGDEGSMNGRLGNAQRIDGNFFSAVLRIDVDSRPGSLAPNPHPAVIGGYRIPPDNPWVGATSFNGKPVDPGKVRTEFWAVGFRNPHRISFDWETGNLYADDVGNTRWEEFNRIVKGGNYGWNWMEGPEVTRFPEVPPPAQRPPVNLQEPIWSYPHTAIAPPGSDPRFVGNCAIGGFVYRGSRYPSLNGKYICGDWANKHVWAITLGPQVIVERIASTDTGVNAFGLHPETGEILTVSFENGFIGRLVPAPDPEVLPPTLSATGVFADVATLTPAAGVLPYEVAAPFWSDFAVKSRWFFLPPGRTISRTDTDEWAFPSGTVWIKHFDLPVVRDSTQTRRIETRFFIKTDEGGYGLTYRWRPDQSDADLVSDAGLDTTFPVEDSGTLISQLWHYPARVECMTCHNPSAGFALGFSTRQLNVPVSVGSSGTVNQLLGLTGLGVFSPGFSSVAGLPRLSRPLDESVPLEHRFKSYTDANCAYCHHAGGPGRGDWDGRFEVPLADSGIVNGAVTGDLGITNAFVVAPGDPARSILYRRIADMAGPQQPAEYHMPPLSTHQRYDAGVQLVSRWITSLAPPIGDTEPDDDDPEDRDPSPGPVIPRPPVTGIRTYWELGTNGPAKPPHAEFSIENRRNDPPPGSPVNLDDDYYFAGSYPAGFNGLKAPIEVARDEPWLNFERALTHRDLTNRIHLTTDSAGPATFRIMFATGGVALNNVVEPGFHTHDVTVLHVANGVEKPIWRGTVTKRQTLVTIPFQAVQGANTLTVVRTGPLRPVYSYWLTFDWLSVEKAP